MSDKQADGPVILVGLGAMGFGIGQSMLRAGIAVSGLDRDEKAAARFAEAGGTAASDEAEKREAIARAGIAVLVVVNAEQTEEVLFADDGLAARMRAGSVVVSCATFAPDRAVDFETRLAGKGIYYLDAPISGGAVKAAAGSLSVMASGHPQAFARARPALDAMAQTVFELGDRAGPGSAMKAVNQLLAGVHIVATAEALTFGVGQGIAVRQMVDVISRCAGTSWMFENRGAFIAEGDYRPHSAVDIFVKDLGIVRDAAAGAALSTPLTEAALARFIAARDAGLGREGDVAVAKIYAREGGLDLPGVKSGMQGEPGMQSEKDA